MKNTIPLREALESSRLYSNVDVKNTPLRLTTDRKHRYVCSYSEWPGVDLFCSQCLRTTTFGSIKSHIVDIKSITSAVEVLDEDSFLYVTYQCTRCKKFRRIFFFTFSKNGQYALKISAYPIQRPRINKDVKDPLSSSNLFDVYKNGLQCEQYGLGIGAASYYRRVVEVSIEEWLDELAEFLDPDDYEKWKEIQGPKPRMESKIELLEKSMGSIVRINNRRPLNELYTLLSRGIHEFDDKDALEIAKVLRGNLEWLLELIAQRRKNNRRFEESQNAIAEILAKIDSGNS